MRKFFKAFYMAFSTFCAIPLPRYWDGSSVEWTMPCFPFVGALIGALWWGTAELLTLIGLHTMPSSAILAFMPFFIAGFIHIDGYMDTSDAILSHRPLEDRLRILKDPHVGSFAVIMIAILFVMQFAVSYAILENGTHLSLLAAIPVVSRCCSSAATLFLKTAPHSGFLKMFTQNAGVPQKSFTVIAFIGAYVAILLIAGHYGMIIAAATTLGYIVSISCAYKCLEGVSGDTVGFANVISELCGAVALALISSQPN